MNTVWQRVKKGKMWGKVVAVSETWCESLSCRKKGSTRSPAQTSSERLETHLQHPEITNKHCRTPDWTTDVLWNLEMEPSSAWFSPVQPSSVQFSPLQPSSAQFSPIKAARGAWSQKSWNKNTWISWFSIRLTWIGIKLSNCSSRLCKHYQTEWFKLRWCNESLCCGFTM